MTKNAYIHVPFCKSKCKYCSFVSYPCINKKQEYVRALIKEISANYKGESLNTLYFGGGTPSLLSGEDLEEILSIFKFDSNTEITLELNPECITGDYLKLLRAVGINRLSIGAQTFDEKILKIIGRRHSVSDIENAVICSKNAGFDNISLDFIYGLPKQTIGMFEKDISRAAELDVQHISLYGLKIDEGCYFNKFPPKNLPDDDIQADMYMSAIRILEENNFHHYEISNLSKRGYESKHNLNYWDNNTYYGFGVAAHGYENGVRYYNTDKMSKYISNPFIHEYSHNLSEQEKIEEEIFLGFRKAEGISTEKIFQKYNLNFEKKYKNTIEKYSEYIEKTQNGYRLNKKGFLISNVILTDFI